MHEGEVNTKHGQIVFRAMPTVREMAPRALAAYAACMLWAIAWIGIGIAIGVGGGLVEGRFRQLSAIAIGPGLVITIAAFGLWPWRPFRYLFRQPMPCAVLSAAYLELQLPGVGVRRFEWQRIGGLCWSDRGSARLVARDGLELAIVPGCLVNGLWRSLAQVIVRYRPDLFALEAHRRYERPRQFHKIPQTADDVTLAAALRPGAEDDYRR